MNAPRNTPAPAVCDAKAFDVNKPFSGHAVPMSSDLARVIALPRRVWSEDAKIALAAWLTDQLRTSAVCDKCGGARAHKPWILGVQEGCYYTDPRRPERARITPPLALRGVQAVVLWELYIGHGQGGYGVYMQVPVGGGKAQPNTEPVLTPAGWRPIGSLQIGDQVIGSAGSAVRVTGVFPQGLKETWKVSFSDGSFALCDPDHLWSFQTPEGPLRTRTAREWSRERLRRPCGEHTAHRLTVPMVAPIERSETAGPLDPYTLGLLLGDGGMTTACVSFTSMDPDIVAGLVLPEGIAPKRTAYQNSGLATQYNLTRGRMGATKNPLKEALKSLGLMGLDSHGKFIPQQYKAGSIAQRLAMLQGLFDTDGHSRRGGLVEYCTTSAQLCADVQEIVESLGGWAKLTNEKKEAFRLNCKLPSAFVAFRCARKVKHHTDGVARRQREPKRWVDAIEPFGQAESTCISVDAPDCLYVTRHHLLTHNTLIFFLAGLMTSAKRGLLFVPASIKADVEPAWNLYTKYWRAPYPLPRVESFQQLTHFGSVDMLEMMRPDLLLGDECDKAKDLSRSAGKRIGRYVDLVRGECTLLFGSGTNKRKSLRDDNHFMTWCLRERTPGFLTDEGLSNACLALDEESKVGAGRLHPGALLELADQMGVSADNPDAPSMGMLARARNGYRLRVEQTPGIVIHDQSECDQPITIDFVLPEPDPEIERRFEHFRMTSKTPETDYAGEAILMPDALTRHRHAQELGSGFFLYWDPRPPAEWLAKRKAWNQFVADEIYTTANCPHQCRHVRCTQRPLDTPLAVENAHPAEDTLLAWREVRDRAPKFEPNSVPGWLSYSVIKSVAKFVGERWTSKGDTGIIWVKHVAFANVLSQATGIPYYGAKGERVDQYGRSVAGDTIEKACQEAAKAGRMAPVAILSLDANLRGRNLQAYANNLNVGWEPAGTRVEQRLGRTHRSGQTRPVTDTIMVTCGEVLDSFQKTLSEARFVKSQGLTHKILTARIDRSGLRAYPKDDFRYTRTRKKTSNP